MTRCAGVCVDNLHGELDMIYHYKIPAGMDVQVGMRCVVPFGRGNKPTTGYIFELADESPIAMQQKSEGGLSPTGQRGVETQRTGGTRFTRHEKQPDLEGSAPIELKEILMLPDHFCVLTRDTLALALWMREKYYTTLIACVRCITPVAKPGAGGAFPGTRAKRKEKKAVTSSVQLTDAQQLAVDAICNAFDMFYSSVTPVFLLHGVTGSGKTEVYLHAIAHVLAAGRQAIVLVPEIGLTPQMVDLFTARFGADVAVTHSRLTAGERFAIWKQAQDSEVKLIIGPRSAVFAPFSDLGLIVIDEEHEHTYHSEVTPKYDAREVAIKRAELTGAVVVLGSATPSVESYQKAESNKGYGALSDKNNRDQGGAFPCGGLIINPPYYMLLTLPERINMTFPEVTVIDMRREMAAGNASLFSQQFAEALGEALAAGRQAILFLNRRGYSSFVSCRWCGEVLSCDRCRVNFTYHASGGALLCHYCGRGMKLPEKCPSCASVHLRRFGMGTQQVESEVARLFPGVGTLRMDFDTTKGKHGHAEILAAFRRGAAQVLIGTQMVAKGLDFPQVVLVGVIAADMSLFTGDFRAAEHTFQLLTQVAGRAGRAGYAGRVFFQTYNPRHYALEFAQQAQYEEFYAHEIEIRRGMNYPPFSHLFSVMLSGPDERAVIAALHKLQAIMTYCNKKERFELMGISPAFVSKVRAQYRWKILIKCNEEEPLKQFVLYCTKKLRENDPLTGINVHLSHNPAMME